MLTYVNVLCFLEIWYNVIMRKTKSRKVKKSTLENKLWKACSNFIRMRDGQESILGIYGECITCGEVCSGSRAHAGHFLPNKACGLLTRYHPHNIYLQCMRCNMPMSRSIAERVKVMYSVKMIDKLGRRKVNELIKLSEHKITPTNEFYEVLTELYKCGDTKNIMKYLLSYTK